MPKVAQRDLDEFGRAVKRARLLRGWTLDQLGAAWKPASGKSFLSNVEKGQRIIGALTVSKLIRALDLPESWIDRFLAAKIAPEAEETPQDREAERLMRMVESDPTAPATAERLLIDLAESISGQRLIDPMAAYASLKSALEAAARIKARGEMPQNHDDQLQAVMREVSRLNDLGLRDEAAAALDEALHRADAARDAIVTLQLDQDRIRDVPDAAAARLIARLKAAAPPGGVRAATRDLIIEWREKGEKQGLAFDLQVARHLAKQNLARARGAQQIASLDDLANCQLRLGERSPDSKYLRAALQNFTANLGQISRRTHPQDWAMTLNNLGIALRVLGDREADPARLREAITAYQAALKVYTRDAAPMDWAMTQNNLGTALRALGAREADPARLRAAITAYQAALEVYTRDAAKMDWAMTQNNLGTALQVLGEREADPARLRDAVTAFQAALIVRTRDATPMHWAATQNNLGLALRWLGALDRAPAAFDQAEAAFVLCLTEHRQDSVPFLWARTQWNLADLALARYELVSDPALLRVARDHALAARAVFAEGSDHQTEKCDTLLARIAALDSGGTTPPSR